MIFSIFESYNNSGSAGNGLLQITVGVINRYYPCRFSPLKSLAYVAQLVEHVIEDHSVGGSTPFVGIMW